MSGAQTPGLCIGATARELLTRPGFAGRVLAVVTGAVYLETRFLRENGVLENEILWLAQDHLPMHPRALRGEFDLSALRVGMVFRAHETRLQFDGQVSLDWGEARVWQPAPIAPEEIAPRESVSARARQLPSPEGARPERSGGSETFRVYSKIAHASRDRDLVRVVKAARPLVGLGQGLTPSGDDFLGGLFFVARHLHAAYPGALHWEQQVIDDWLEWARPRTNAISHTLLRDHARGQGVEPLHDWVAALLQGKDLNEIMPHVQRVSAIGSASGWDMLAGAVTGMLLIA